MAVYSKAWYRAMTIPNAMAAFRRTGDYLFCPINVSATDTTFKCQQLIKDTGLPFIPVLSPARPPHRPLNPGH